MSMDSDPRRSAEEFRVRTAEVRSDGWRMYRAFRGEDFDVRAWEWLLEAGPVARPGATESVVAGWCGALIAYNAWATSVGRPPATEADLVKGGAGKLLPVIFRAVLTRPAIRARRAETYARLTDQRLEETLGTIRAQQLASVWLASQGDLAAVASVTPGEDRLAVALITSILRTRAERHSVAAVRTSALAGRDAARAG